ncbi:MAG: PilZ domain-containing protein [Deltaproteobacteria bacterium]
MAIVKQTMQNEFHKESIIPLNVKKGKKIKLKHYSVFEPLTNVIGNIKGSNIIMDLPQKLLENNILVGDNIVCIYFDNNEEYVLTGEVANITLLFPQQLTIKVDNVEKFNNQRMHVRYSVSLSANATQVNVNEPYFAVVKNVSIVGVSITSKQKFDNGAELLIDIAVSKNNIISYYGKIIRVRQLPNFYEYGIVQTKIDDVNYRELVKYIQKLEQEEESMFSGEEEK